MASRQNRPAGWGKRGIAVFLVAVLLTFLLPTQPANAEASLNADLLSEPVFIAFASQSPEGDIRVFYTVWAPNTATGVWTGAGVTINLDTATYSYPAVCGDGTAVQDVYPNVTIYTMCSALNGYLPSPVDRLTVTWTTDADGDSVNTTFDRAFWWFLSPADELAPPPSGQHVEDWATPWLGVGVPGVGMLISKFSTTGMVTFVLHPIDADWLSSDTFSYLDLRANGINLVLRAGQGKICLYTPTGSPFPTETTIIDYSGTHPDPDNCFEIEDNTRVSYFYVFFPSAAAAFVNADANAACNLLQYADVLLSHPVWSDAYTPTTTEFAPPGLITLDVHGWGLEWRSIASHWYLYELSSKGVGYICGAAWISAEQFSDTPPWEVSTTTYDPGSWTGIGDVIGLPTASETETTSTSYTATGWTQIFCKVLDLVGKALDVLSAPWDLVSKLLGQLSEWLDKGRNFLLAGFAAIKELPPPIDTVVGFSLFLLLTGLLYGLAKQLIQLAEQMAATLAHTPWIVIALIIALAVSAIASALGRDISQTVTVCNYTVGVQASSSGTYFGGGEGGGGGDSGLR